MAEKMLEKARDFIRSRKEFVIVTHYDADGLTAGAIASLVLDRLGKENIVIPVKKLDEKAIEGIASQGENFWFVDLGSGQIEMIDKYVGSNYVICDHHETLGEGSGLHLNAHLLGWDGSKEISGAGMTYLLARYIDKKNRDLSALAIVGAVGDMQDSTGALVGKNREILNDGVSEGVLENKIDIRLFGRHTRPLIQFLSYSSDPVFPGLSGDDVACARFLMDLGIPLKRDGEWLRYVDLTDEEKRKLITGLHIYGTSMGMSEKSLKALVGEVYELVKEEEKSYTRDAKDFATLLNACGRHNAMEVGISVAKGDRDEAYREAVAILQRHRKALHDAIEWVSKHGIEETDSMYILDAGSNVKDTIVGIVAGMLYNTGLVSRSKPVVALAVDEEGNLKVSGRGNWDLVRRGLNLGKAMKEVAGELGEVGGGHNIAAGATVSPEKKNEFLEKLAKKLREQLS